MSSLTPPSMPRSMPQNGAQQPFKDIPGFRTHVNGLKFILPHGMFVIDHLRSFYDNFSNMILSGVPANSGTETWEKKTKDIERFLENFNIVYNVDDLDNILSTILPLANQIGKLMASMTISTEGHYDELFQSRNNKNLETDPDVNKHLSSVKNAVDNLKKELNALEGNHCLIVRKTNTESVNSDFYLLMVDRIYINSIHFGLALGKFTTSHDKCLKIIAEGVEATGI
ncbi:hypothetical protein H4219_005741 [Mycoemilia scoparia]|uniref:Uncharacterized protein n=1 Tax=Mycoemilia scoparia TaxID=417184 RepID=A0A9W7ZS05_9FUNG|nr:hypothetical protein H4219_005741 [Mycoemilia scoparia]